MLKLALLILFCLFSTPTLALPNPEQSFGHVYYLAPENDYKEKRYYKNYCYKEEIDNAIMEGKTVTVQSVSLVEIPVTFSTPSEAKKFYRSINRGFSFNISPCFNRKNKDLTQCTKTIQKNANTLLIDQKNTGLVDLQFSCKETALDKKKNATFVETQHCEGFGDCSKEIHNEKKVFPQIELITIMNQWHFHWKANWLRFHKEKPWTDSSPYFTGKPPAYYQMLKDYYIKISDPIYQLFTGKNKDALKKFFNDFENFSGYGWGKTNDQIIFDFDDDLTNNNFDFHENWTNKLNQLEKSLHLNRYGKGKNWARYFDDFKRKMEKGSFPKILDPGLVPSNFEGPSEKYNAIKIFMSDLIMEKYDYGLPWDERVDELMNSLTLPENEKKKLKKRLNDIALQFQRYSK